MHKTLHKKLTEKHYYDHPQTISFARGEGIHSNSPVWQKPGSDQEMDILKEAAKDLLQPRPQAIAKLLAMAKDL